MRKKRQALPWRARSRVSSSGGKEEAAVEAKSEQQWRRPRVMRQWRPKGMTIWCHTATPTTAVYLDNLEHAAKEAKVHWEMNSKGQVKAKLHFIY